MIILYYVASQLLASQHKPVTYVIVIIIASHSISCVREYPNCPSFRTSCRGGNPLPHPPLMAAKAAVTVALPLYSSSYSSTPFVEVWIRPCVFTFRYDSTLFGCSLFIPKVFLHQDTIITCETECLNATYRLQIIKCYDAKLKYNNVINS